MKRAGKFRIDLSQIEDFAYKLQSARNEVMRTVEQVANAWASGTKTEYAGKIKYANGFNIKGHQNKTPFHQVDSLQEKALRVSVGHSSFL